MRNPVLILFFAAFLNLSCAQPQKTEANLAVTNTNNKQTNSETPATSADALSFLVFEDGKVFLQKESEKDLLGTTSEPEKLRQTFKDLLKKRENKIVSVAVPRGTSYKPIETVIDLLKSVGAKPLAMQVNGLKQ